MTSFFDGIDLAPDAAFLLWFAVGMMAIGLAIGVYMAARWVWRRVGSARRSRNQLRRLYEAQLTWERQHGRRR